MLPLFRSPIFSYVLPGGRGSRNPTPRPRPLLAVEGATDRIWTIRRRKGRAQPRTLDLGGRYPLSTRVSIELA